MTPWGLLPLALPLAWLTVRGTGALVLPRACAFESVLAGGVLTLALVIVGVRVLGSVGLLNTWVLLGSLMVVTLLVSVAARGAAWRLPLRRAVSGPTVAVLLVVVAGVAIVIVAAYYLPIWQWDA
ncbi:MAG: hypothetical protein JO152_02150, partial [Mycobacteriaceae bacterium]|nr:hypothetical protein [Mycobacteriaceae bacterium]